MLIKQTIVYTSGLFRGQVTERYIYVYKRQKPFPVLGWGYKVISEERLK